MIMLDGKKQQILIRSWNNTTSRSFQQQENKEEVVPLVPLMMWMLSPAVILAWTSVELLVPGITMSETDEERQTCFFFCFSIIH